MLVFYPAGFWLFSKKAFKQADESVPPQAEPTTRALVKYLVVKELSMKAPF